MTSPLAENDSIIGEALSTSLNPSLYTNPLEEIESGRVEDEARRDNAALECSQGAEEVHDGDGLVNAVGEVPEGMCSGAELEGFKIINALKKANFSAASETQAVIDTSGIRGEYRIILVYNPSGEPAVHQGDTKMQLLTCPCPNTKLAQPNVERSHGHFEKKFSGQISRVRTCLHFVGSFMD